MGRLFSSMNQPVAKAKKSNVSGKHLLTTKKSCLLSKLAFAVKSAKIKENVSKHNNDDHTDANNNHVKVEPMLTMEEKRAMGLLVVTQDEKRVAVKVCYITEFDEPDESEWPTIITILSKLFCLHPQTIRKVFTACCNGKEDAEKQMKGAGRKFKLEPDNPGLIVGAAALNGLTSLKMATEI